MSLIACISVYNCDLCNRIETVRSEREYTRFQNFWHDGWKYSLCQDCRYSPRAAPLIREDDRFEKNLAEAIKRSRVAASAE